MALNNNHSLTHQYFTYIIAIRFIGGGNLEHSEKTTDLLQVTEKLYIT